MKKQPNKIEAEYIEKVITEYLEKYPDSPSQTIAKAIHKEHPLICNGVIDNIRANIRNRRGSDITDNPRTSCVGRLRTTVRGKRDSPVCLGDKV